MYQSNNSLGRVTKLIGQEIINRVGRKLGKLEAIMVDLQVGNIAYAVLSFEEFFDLKDKYFAIPWKLLHIDKQNQEIRLYISRERLKVMPGFDKDDWPKMEDPLWQAQIADYYHDYS